MEQDLPFTMQTRPSDRTRPEKKPNPYGDDFVVERIDLKKIVEKLVGLEDLPASQDIQSKPEVEFDDVRQHSDEQEITNLRVLE